MIHMLCDTFQALHVNFPTQCPIEKILQSNASVNFPKAAAFQGSDAYFVMVFVESDRLMVHALRVQHHPHWC